MLFTAIPKNIWEWFTAPTSLISSPKANFYLWFIQCQTMRLGYLFSNTPATPDFLPSITLSPSSFLWGMLRQTHVFLSIQGGSLLQSWMFVQIVQEDIGIKMREIFYSNFIFQVFYHAFSQVRLGMFTPTDNDKQRHNESVCSWVA